MIQICIELCLILVAFVKTVFMKTVITSASLAITLAVNVTEVQPIIVQYAHRILIEIFHPEYVYVNPDSSTMVIMLSVIAVITVARVVMDHCRRIAQVVILLTIE